MKKLSLLLVICMICCAVIPTTAYAAEDMGETNISTCYLNDIGTVTMVEKSNGETVYFYKVGMEYKVRYEDETVETWAYDEYMPIENSDGMTTYSSVRADKSNPPVFSGWLYLYTYHIITNINYTKLNAALEGIYVVQDIINTICNVLVVPAVIASYIYAYSPSKIYLEEDTYANEGNSLYFMTKNYYYTNSSFTTLIGSDTKYYTWG